MELARSSVTHRVSLSAARATRRRVFWRSLSKQRIASSINRYFITPGLNRECL
jgi:hypothetical protein